MTGARYLLGPVTLAAALALAGCAERIDAPLSPTFGVAAASLDSQIAHPGPVDLRPPVTSGARAVLALRRYETDKVIQPANSSTSEVSASSVSTSSTSVSK